MSELLHRVKVFVFQMTELEPRYLLLRGAQGIESFWGPIHGSIGFGEPLDLIDLQMPSRLIVGDEEIIEWSFGFKSLPTREQLKLDKRWAEFRWAQFSQGYPMLEFDTDRAAIMKLHTLLRAA